MVGGDGAGSVGLMFSGVAVVYCAAFSLLLCTVAGLPVARRIGSGATAVYLAPAIGWSVLAVLGLPLLRLTGLTASGAALAVSVIIVGTLLVTWRWPVAAPDLSQRFRIVDGLLLAGVGILAAAVAAAVVPKMSSAGIALSDPIFDHSKVAMIDEMMRVGIPPINPYLGDSGAPQRLSYYYLWHLFAAMMAILSGVSAWEADAALSWVTAASSLALMIGLAALLGARRLVAGGWVLLLAATGSLRPALLKIVSAPDLAVVVGWPTGLGGWLFQATWAPQHLAAASSALLSITTVFAMFRQPRIGLALLLGISIAACFQSSSWIGGVTLPLAMTTVAVICWVGSPGTGRRRALLLVFAAGALAIALSMPFLLDQMRMATLRSDGALIVLRPHPVLETAVPSLVRSWLNPVAFWLLLVPVEFPASCLLAALLLPAFWRRQIDAGQQPRLWLGLLACMGAGLLVAAWLASAISNNNDLAWRGVLPALMAAMVLAATALDARALRQGKALSVALVLVVGAASLDGAAIIRSNLSFRRSPTQDFEVAAQMWQAVRQKTGIEDRIANNPDFLAGMTVWPINISWALQAGRRSCYAGADLVLPFSSLTRAARAETEARFRRLFAGSADDDDLRMIALQHDCRMIVLTARDPAFASFDARSGPYQLAEATPGWKLYIRRDDATVTLRP